MQADIEEKQLFVSEVTDWNVEEEYAEEVRGSANNCHESQS